MSNYKSQSRSYSRKLAHDERVRKIATHVLRVADHRVKVAASGAEMLDSIGNHMSDNAGAYIGGAAGAVGGGAIGAASGSRGNRLGKTIAGALLGGGAGAGAGYAVDRHRRGREAEERLALIDSLDDGTPGWSFTAEDMLGLNKRPTGPRRSEVPRLLRGEDYKRRQLALIDSIDDGRPGWSFTAEDMLGLSKKPKYGPRR